MRVKEYPSHSDQTQPEVQHGMKKHNYSQVFLRICANQSAMTSIYDQQDVCTAHKFEKTQNQLISKYTLRDLNRNEKLCLPHMSKTTETCSTSRHTEHLIVVCATLYSP